MAPDLQNPMSSDQAVYLWRHLLFDRTSFGPQLTGASLIPDHFLPQHMLQNISIHHEAMSRHNRAVSTLALITVLRYLMSEVSRTLDVADALARAHQDDTVEVELDEDDQDTSLLMQKFVMTEGRDTMESRGTRAILRLHKELLGQPRPVQLAHVKKVQLGLPPTTPEVNAGSWREQLEAVLVALGPGVDEHTELNNVDEVWFGQWVNEITVFVPGFQEAVGPIQVESQTTMDPVRDLDHELNLLLEDEDSERAWQEQRAQEEAAERDRLQEFETMCAKELVELRADAHAFRAWEQDQMVEAMARAPPPKRRCVLTVEAASSSSDRPRVMHTFAVDVPVNGTPVSLTIRATMEPDPENVSTRAVTSVPVEQPNQGQRGDGPGELLTEALTDLSFEDYQRIYDQWQRGELLLAEIIVQYGSTVAELLQSQRALMVEETAVHMEQETDGVAGNMPASVEPGEALPGLPTSPLMAAGAERPRFCFFESMYGQWKAGLRTSLDIRNSFGDTWLILFTQWKLWGLTAIEGRLGEILDMTRDPPEGSQRPLNAEYEDSVHRCSLKIPFGVVKQVYQRWKDQLISDATIEEVYGSRWFELFQRMREYGLNACRAELSELVEWDLEDLLDMIAAGDKDERDDNEGPQGSTGSNVVSNGEPSGNGNGGHTASPGLAEMTQLDGETEDVEGVSIEQRANILAYGRHFHPSLEPRCLVQDGNNSWAAFPAVQVSETRLRCLLTPTKYGRHTENLTFAFASRVKVAGVRMRSVQTHVGAPEVRDCGNESIEMEVWEEYDDDDMMEMGNDSNMSIMSGNTSAMRRRGNVTEARAMRPRYFEYTNCSFEVDPVPETHVSEQMVAPLGVGYNTEASIPASLNPNLVHVAGGAELAIYGNFYGQEDMWCGFEGVRQRSRAVRISNLEIRCQVPPRTVGISRVYLTARDARGLPSVMSANVGMMQLEYVEPVHLFDVEPKQVIDGKSTHLKVHGSNFRPVSALRCGFESRVQRRSLLTHRIPVWTWLGHVQCSSRIAADAIRTFVMFSAEALEPLDRVDPFMCVSYQKDGTWVYHLFDENGVLAEPLLPRLDDTLVAEIRGKDIISLESYTGTFAGVHIGYDRGDLEFQPDIDNLTQWMLDRDIELPKVIPRRTTSAPTTATTSTEPASDNESNASTTSGLQPELQEEDEVENDTNETAQNISLNVTVTKRTTTVRSSTTSFLAPTTTAGPDNSDGADENVSDDSEDVNQSDNASTTTQTTTTSSTTSTTTSSTTTSSTSTSSSTSSTSTTTSSSSTTSSSTSTTTSTSSTSTTSSTSSTTSSTSSTTITSTTTTSSTTSTVTTTDENATWSNYTDDNETLEEIIPDIINVWVSGGDFFVNREVGWETNFVTTEPEYLSRHLILCPTPDGLSWLRKGEDKVKLRVTLNGQEWSDSSLGLTVLHRDVEPEMGEDLVLLPDIPRLEVQGNLSHDPELRFRLAQVTPVVGPSSGGTDLTLTITTWPRLLPDFHFDCVIGLQRVPATLLQIQSSPDFRSYTLGCTVPIAMNIPRLTAAGCTCKKVWFTPSGQMCDSSCDGPSPDPSESSGASPVFACTLAHGVLPNADVVAQYQDTVEQVGWAKLHIHGRPRSPGSQISQKDRLRLAFAAGFAEGAMTTKRSYEHKLSYRQAYFKGNYTSYAEAESFLMQNDRFVREKIKSAEDDWWAEIAIVWAQLDGLVAGNAAACGQNCLSLLDFLFFQAEQDIYNIVKVPFAEDEWTLKRAAEFTRETSHCSSIIRLAPNNSDLFVGHNTWTGYYSMLRLLKEYDMPLGGAADKVVFSGYFGQLYSGDDFYTLSSGLTVQETTNSLYNKSTAALIKPESVLTWARTLVANRRATDGSSWARWFSPFNSGTINNQWQVVATSKFRPGEEVPDGMLTVLEQMPGIIVWEDVSEVLRSQGFWVSYNSPYFPTIREASGADFMERRYGDAYSYTKNPRAKIFARDILKATDLQKVQKLLRYNNWREDPLSAHGYEGPWEPRAPENAIAARYDLHPWENTTEAFGNTDGKICTASDCQALRFSAISGPTADQQPPFSWTGRWRTSPHVGQPEVFNFSWISFAAMPAPSMSTVMV
ncbi:plbB [Symbiodinium sp. CCMP2592]|nr:plbB [Symbiodinium sp. CCMP2592]